MGKMTDREKLLRDVVLVENFFDAASLQKHYNIDDFAARSKAQLALRRIEKWIKKEVK